MVVSRFGLNRHNKLEHPAKFSPAVMDAIRSLLDLYPFAGPILDPFAGVGRIHDLADEGYETVGVELEPEWASCHPLTIVGDATCLPAEWSGRFGAIVTSPPYGNRMADSYAGDAKNSRRHTYRIALGRALTKDSAAGLQWGDSYRETMLLALREVKRVLRPGGMFVLNISDHVRGGELQMVPQWYETTCQQELSLDLVEWRDVGTQRLKHGANANLRAACERVYVFRKQSGGSL